MEIRTNIKRMSGDFEIVYNEADPLENLDGKILQAVHAYCFLDGKLVIVYANDKRYWTMPGGGIEPGESYEQATIREVLEESNMKVIYSELIGYQDIFEKEKVVRQTRMFCIVEPYGPFISDPDGDITEIKLIEPSELRKYVDWGVIGDRVLERAIEMHRQLNRLSK